MTGATSPGRRVDGGSLQPILWMSAEPARLARDRREVTDFAPLLQYHPPDFGEFRHGGWGGELPRWPFNRPQPVGLDEVLGSAGLQVVVQYSAAHPMVPPVIYPVDPEPSWWEQTQSAWHVAPGGSLCLLQSDGAWQPEASITELLAKAAGWRIEYALMKAGAIEQMSLRGIVSDPSYDHLVTNPNDRIADVPEPDERTGADGPE